ncbi:MAG: hypothetical protein GWN47_07305 [Woeseiaceae bacterium]|nr:hypothetical protein [Woeseiaceae bacterium]
MASTDKTKFNQFQSLVTILTPVIVAIGGFYGYVLQKEVSDAEAKATAAQTQIAEIETSIRNVEAMETYFKMMGGDNNAEAKMAAYALYMLNKEDPEMAVSMIMAPGKEHLMSVLIDLGSREPKIFEEVQKILETQDDTRQGTSMQQTAQRIIGDIGSSPKVIGTDTTDADEDTGGWSYLGNFATGAGTRIELPAGALPAEGESYTLNMDVNIRSDYPRKENNYRQAGVIGVARKGDEIVITQLDIDRKKRVWARIQVATQ